MEAECEGSVIQYIFYSVLVERQQATGSSASTSINVAQKLVSVCFYEVVAIRLSSSSLVHTEQILCTSISVLFCYPRTLKCCNKFQHCCTICYLWSCGCSSKN